MLKIGQPGRQPMQIKVKVTAFPGKQASWKWELRSGAQIKNDVHLGKTVTLTALDKHGNPTCDIVPQPAAGRQAVRVINKSDANAKVSSFM